MPSTAHRAANRQHMANWRQTCNGCCWLMAQPLITSLTGTLFGGNVGDVQAMRDSIAPQRINPQNLPATAEQIRALLLPRVGKPWKRRKRHR